MRTCLPFLVLLAVCGTGTATEPWRDVRDRVDGLVAERWKQAGVVPVPPAAESTLLRRTYLDLTGRIPTVGETRAYLADSDPAKHARLVDRLIGNTDEDVPPNPRYATHMANRWRATMLVGTDNRLNAGRAPVVESWLRRHFVENTPYDQFARELLTAELAAGQSGPGVYLTALELKPEKLAASTSRILLGMQIECAQCHDHPFDEWTQRDFWGYAAFFARIQRGNARQRAPARTGLANEVTLPDTDEVVPPRYPGADHPLAEEPVDRRRALAEWITARDNPYFARAAVNRLWATLFGYGLVDPVDDFGGHNAASHPEVLDLLAEDFARHGYDVQRTLRILANTRAYGLSSETNDAVDPRLYAAMPVKSLTPEQIYDTLQRATMNKPTAVVRGQVFNPRFDQRRTAFLAKFRAPSGSATEFEGGIPQALTMMNGAVVAELTNPAESELVTVLAESPFLTGDSERIEILFYSTLVREPTSDERERFVSHLERTDDRRAALADVLWALLNSTEFLLNH